MAKGNRGKSELLRLAHGCHSKKRSDESIYPQDLPAVAIMYLRRRHDYPQVWLKVCWLSFHIMSLSRVYRRLRKYKVMHRAIFSILLVKQFPYSVLLILIWIIANKICRYIWFKYNSSKYTTPFINKFSYYSFAKWNIISHIHF